MLSKSNIRLEAVSEPLRNEKSPLLASFARSTFLEFALCDLTKGSETQCR